VSDSLRVLLVSPTLPYRFSGFGTRVWHLVDQLSRLHSVTVLTFVRPDEAEAVSAVAGICSRLETVRRAPSEGLGRRVSQLARLASPLPYACVEQRTEAMQDAFDVLVRDGDFDVVIMESTRLGALALPVGLPVVFDEHNVEYELLRRMSEGERSRPRQVFNALEYAKFKRLEQHCWRRSAGVALTSSREEAIVARQAPTTPTAVVPNGVDVEHFTPSADEPEPETVVFTGMLSYRPNLDAAQFLVEEIMPRVKRTYPNAVLRLVGHIEQADRERFEGSHCEVIGWVPDVRVPMAAASVIVAPLRMGSGTRLKIVEALGMGKAVVSTSLGCEGLDVREGEHLLIADSADAFAGKVERLLADRTLARELGARGRDLAVQKYSWGQSTARLEQLLRHVVDSGRRSVAAQVRGG
jgi:glycosyltransferase involved in cell wall biosynthesis